MVTYTDSVSTKVISVSLAFSPVSFPGIPQSFCGIFLWNKGMGNGQSIWSHYPTHYLEC